MDARLAVFLCFLCACAGGFFALALMFFSPPPLEICLVPETQPLGVLAVWKP